MNLEILYAFVLATAALAFAPGPDNIYVLMQSMVHGVKSGLATVFGLMSGCVVHTSLVAFGVSVLIKQSPFLFTGLKVVGAGYLLFLAYKVFKGNAHIQLGEGHVPKKTYKSLFVQGFFMNVLNPKVSIFFLAFFPGFLFSDSMNSVWQFYILGAIFIVVSFIIFAFIAILAGRISIYLKQHKNTGLVLKWLQIVVFMGIAAFLLLK
ncbi:LysE family translocator [Galbibacter pacificus]|uniref:LysE family translocator n=1 Tax=Galbibacter pacificus TaxID=2996052 RepID=A0ABT6FVF6_9FLAO|nr:LysE family translocator [Galbibacter pacificus]MDG3583831.1 LysE family translocator [Galbibacter pacificus]MDG3587251.1 LysE family translocator [Galbibacter pacificus]